LSDFKSESSDYEVVVTELLSLLGRCARSATRVERGEAHEVMGGPGKRIWPLALTVGLISTTLGALVSAAVPGRAFLAVWAIVTFVVAIGAAWEAERLHEAALRVVVIVRRTR
jgi:hypothetical protein